MAVAANVEDVATPAVLVMATQLVPLWLSVHPLVLPKVAEAPSDPLLLQNRPVIHSPQLSQGDVGPHLYRLPGPLRDQTRGDQAAHRVFQRVVYA